MKWYHWLVLLATALLAFGAGYAYHWYNTPLDCPLCLCKSAALPPDYLQYWGEFIALVQLYAKVAAAGVGIVAVAVIVELGLMVRQLVTIKRLIEKQGA